MLVGRDELVPDVHMERPHVVILGAGASRAAFPDGDRNGALLPLMDDLVDRVGIKPILGSYGYPYSGGNFEELYSKVVEDSALAEMTAEIEAAVRAYFARMQLPDEPTLYDHLVLSLRSKDVIATFNWDPFLAQACARNAHHADLPVVLFLHGNVAMGCCDDHRRSGLFPGRCSACGRPYAPTRLLYPTTHKDYNADPYTSSQWRMLQAALKDAYLLTIFGYAAPSSDVEARQLMEQAWGSSDQRELEETEVIDTKAEESITDNWSPFICSHHYRIARSFYESMVAKYPRRSCEAMWRQLMEVQFVEDAPLPWDADFDGLYAAVHTFGVIERTTKPRSGT